MMHEKIVSRDKQSVEAESSSRSMREVRRESVLSTDEIEDESDATSTSYHIQNFDQLKYWLKKDEASVVTAWTNMRDEHVSFFDQLNKKMKEMNELTKEYNNQANKLHDAILIIRELKVELRERNISENNSENSNTLLSITEDEVVVLASTATFKKLSDSSVFIDEKDPTIDDWLSVMRNKLEENADWFSIDVQQKTYVRIKIEDDAMKHLISRFFKNSIKSYIISKKIFENLYQIFDDSNRRINVLKIYRRLKQVESFKDFNTFWAEFQRLVSDSKLYNQEALLEDLKNKMSYELQKVFATESYKTTDLHEFAKMCRYTNQILRNVNNKFRREEFFSDAARDEEVIVIVNSNQINQNVDRTISRSRFEISELESNSRAITQSSENQVNFINCYNCGKLEHFSRNCRQSRKMNSNSFVREIEKDSSSQEKNLESDSRKE